MSSTDGMRNHGNRVFVVPADQDDRRGAACKFGYLVVLAVRSCVLGQPDRYSVHIPFNGRNWTEIDGTEENPLTNEILGYPGISATHTGAAT